MADDKPTREEYKTGQEDFAKIIASETCGLTEAIPEEDDNQLADLFVKIVNHGARHAVSHEKFKRRIMAQLDLLEFDGTYGSGA